MAGDHPVHVILLPRIWIFNEGALRDCLMIYNYPGGGGVMVSVEI